MDIISDIMIMGADYGQIVGNTHSKPYMIYQFEDFQFTT